MENTIVKEIHSSFTAAQEQLLVEAKQLLDASGNPEKVQSSVQLSKLGFSQSENVKILSDKEQKRAAEIKHYLDKYKKIAPQYRFITDEKRIEICKKYGLVMADVERFTGQIPDKNVQDIVNFKVLDDSCLKTKTPIKWKDVPVTEMSSRHLVNAIAYMSRDSRTNIKEGHLKIVFEAFVREAARRGELDLMRHDNPEDYGGCDMYFYPSGGRVDIHSSILEPQDKLPKMYIVSDIGQLDETKALLDEEKMYLSEEKFWDQRREEEEQRRQLMMQEDPIVLAEVEGGFLIVTAWGGPEASDPDVVQPNHN